MKKLKILFVRRTPVNKYSGIANYCQALFNLFSNDDLLQPLPVEDLPSLPSHIFHFYYRLPPLIRAIRKADIVHVNGYTEMGAAEALLVAKCMGRKTIYTAHWHPFEHLTHPTGAKWFFRLIMQPAIKLFADTVITINNEDTRFFSSFHRHVEQIPHWVQSPGKPPTDISRQSDMVLFVGRLSDSMKGVEYLSYLPVGRYDLHLVGNGDTTLRPDMTVHRNMPISELHQLYAKASLLVVPSKYEAFSYATLEALMYGTPVVLSDRVRIADYLDGVAGIRIFPYGNTDAFCQAVAETLGSQVDTKRVASIFDIKAIKQRYKTTYLNSI